ncbi:MAG: TlpA disulfide reductase family protein [Gammaproteobacteria bacterium]|nr:TlpA disulfide reductase family protein [Gammaproteobacteria bacterium]MDP2141911.1 TlpA disulfide reductase family protein [Gammaproteobacteria bacterium]MDP2347207.1 TlpA disulfide reductase family protein [Gammaproteobacteria bacterium]
MRFRELPILSALLFSAAAVPSAMSLEKGELAPAFVLPDIEEGKPAISLEALRGKTVYVDFWASWCAPCLRSLPQINELYAEYRNRGFEVIAINVDDPIEDGQDFLLDTPLDYLIAADTDNAVLTEYGVFGMPTSFLIDPEGVVRMVHMGFKEKDIEVIEAELTQVLDEFSPR